MEQQDPEKESYLKELCGEKAEMGAETVVYTAALAGNA